MDNGGGLTPEDCEKKYPYMVHPASDFRRRWNLLALCIILYCSVDLPIDIAFYQIIEVNAGFVINTIFDAFFIIDIILNFRTGFEYHGRVVMDRSASAKHYLCGDFKFDALASLPVDYFAFASSNTSLSKAPKIIRVLRLFRLVRLLRLPRLFRYTRGYSSSFHAGYVRVAKLIFLLLLFAHWNACLLFLVASLQQFSATTWVGLMDLESSPVSTQYSWALFMSISHMLCIGYGVYPPETLPELWAITFSMSLGASMFACIVGSVTAVLLSLDSASASFQGYTNELEAYFTHKEIPPSLRLKVNNYIQSRWSRDSPQEVDRQGPESSLQGLKMYSEERILDKLSPALRRELMASSVTSTLDKNPVFTASFFGSTLQVYMCTSLTQEWFQEGDHILVQGAPGSSVYFVKSGSVEVNHSGAPLGVLPPGSYFGEAPLLFPSALQPLTFVSATPSSAFEWKISAFFKCLEQFPDLREVMELVLEQKMRRLGMESWKDRARLGKKDVQKERIRQLTTLFEEGQQMN